MPLELQVKLLRVLETGQVDARRRRRGRSSVDVRVIAATNRDPERRWRSGKLREDLLYRLERLPDPAAAAARARASDVELLAQHFLDELNQAHGTAKALHAAALASAARATTGRATCASCSNVVERAYILADEEIAPRTSCRLGAGARRATGTSSACGRARRSPRPSGG